MKTSIPYAGSSSARSLEGKRGFTLIELLVVIAILSILMAMLFPTIQSSLEKGRSANCRSNLRQLTAAWSMYCADNKGISLHGAAMSTGMTDHYWLGDLKPYLGTPREGGHSVVMCPSTKPWDPEANQTVSGYGTADTAYQNWINDADGETIFVDASYALNDRLVYAPNGAWWVGPDAYYQTGTGVDKPADTPAFSDGVLSIFVGDPSLNIYTPPPYPFYDGGPGGLQRICVDRHNKAINVAFADGHARRVKLPELYTLTYGRDTPAEPPDVSSWFPDEYY